MSAICADITSQSSGTQTFFPRLPLRAAARWCWPGALRARPVLPPPPPSQLVLAPLPEEEEEEELPCEQALCRARHKSGWRKGRRGLFLVPVCDLPAPPCHHERRPAPHRSTHSSLVNRSTHIRNNQVQSTAGGWGATCLYLVSGPGRTLAKSVAALSTLPVARITTHIRLMS